MSLDALDAVSYKFPSPTILGLEPECSLGQICKSFQSRISSYSTIQNRLLNQLNSIYKSSINFNDKRNINLSDFIKDVCIDSDEANYAYKFYGCKIIDKINTLGDYICQVQDILNNIGGLKKDPHALVVHMEVLDQFCNDLSNEFSTQYQYDFDEDIWVQVDSLDSQISPEGGKFSKFSDIQNLNVNADKKGSVVKKRIEIFRELNLIDRLKYIKMYYDIQAGKSDSLFPEGKTIGFPSVKEDYSKTAYNEDNKKIAALEQFYLGYLIDRDGAPNAVASFLDIKVTAVKYNIELAMRHINALNEHLLWTNRGLELFNQSQSEGKNPIAAGSYMILTNVCDSISRATMQLDLDGDNVPEDYLILQYAGTNSQFLRTVDGYHLSSVNRYVLLKVGSTAMDYILNGGNNANDNTDIIYFDRIFWDTNTALGNRIKDNTDYSIYNGFSYSPKFDCKNANQVYVLTFKSDAAAKANLPKESDLRRVDPGSVKDWANSNWRNAENDDNKNSARNQSWQDAFQSVVDAINTSIETVQTEIQNLRTKIDTYTNLANTFRNRTFEVASKIITHIRG